MTVHRNSGRTLGLAIATALLVSACSLAGPTPSGLVGSTTGPTAGPSSASDPGGMPHGSPPAQPVARSSSSPAAGRAPQPGAVACGPVTVSQTGPLCVPTNQEPYLNAAEKLLTAGELASAVAVVVDEDANMCTGLPATDCAGPPPLALVTFRQSAETDSIRILLWRTSDGSLTGKRV